MNQQELKNIVEAALMATQRPLSIDHLIELFAPDTDTPPSRDTMRAVLNELEQDYLGRGIELKAVASGFRVQVRAEISGWVNRLWDERPPRYTRALLETLAIIAYRQPITRGEIESVRGVAVSSSIVKTLMEREWIRVAGHRDAPGRPAVYVTTRQFLDYFNLRSLSQLPALMELKENSEFNLELFQPESLSQQVDEQSTSDDETQVAVSDEQPLDQDKDPGEVQIVETATSP